ncbi:NUDIX domain-containing protein [Streptomyces sp. NPDC094448]|uniref:NUDIX domain-containing protein n=1 Tax=Streptomyces sp. NPDC094448 TaxID=3366063 RepID=UPI0038087D5C
MGSDGELIDIVDEADRVTGRATRGEAYARGLRHRVAFVLVRNADDRIFVHRRTAAKRVFPSLYDMFVGGVVGAGETYDAAALREAEEELGVSGLPRPVPLFTFPYDSGTALGSWNSAVYEVRCTLPVRPQAEEIAWWDFLPEEEVERRLRTWQWTPDGLAAYELLRARRADTETARHQP